MSYQLSKVFASTLSGEPFHPGYEKNQKNFRNIVRSDNLLEREIKQYFQGLSERAWLYVNWQFFEQEKKAGITDLFSWDTISENKIVAGILASSLIYALVAGGNQTEEDTKIDIGWNEKNGRAIDFLNKYSIKLSGELSDTTLDQVKSSIKFSMLHGETIEEAKMRLSQYIDNPKRAATIAHTESVRAYSQGRLAVAKEIGADRKRWSTTSRACPICQSLDGKVIAMDKLFNNEYDAPPAHPNCRCLVEIILKGEKV